MNEHRRLLQIALRRDLSLFTRKCFGTLLPGDRFRPNWHLDAIAYKLEEVIAGNTKRLLITVPPRSAKSLLASVACPAFLLGRDPTARVVCASYAQPLAVTFSNQCRTIMGSAWYRDAFPGTVLSPRKNTEAEFQTTRHGGRLATSVGGVLTGRGGDVIIIDDPLKPADALSDTIRTDTNRWFDQTVLSRLDDKTEGAIVLVMQRLHVDDLAGHLLERGGWEHLNLPAVAEIDELIPIARGKVHARRIGELLHPEREPQSVLDEMKLALGAAGFAAQYQQQPVPLGGNMIDWAWFRRFRGDLGRDDCDSIVQSWDTASKPGELNDYSVCTTWLIRCETFYLLDVLRERLGAPELRRRVVQKYRDYRPECVLIEDKGSGISLIQELRHAGEMHVVARNPEGDKILRAHSQSARIEAGQVFLPETAPWLDEFQREVMAFPHGRHDDQVDSLSQFLIWAVQRHYNVPRIREL